MEEAEYFELFIPEVKNYGGVILIDNEPILFILDENNKMIDGISIYNYFEELDNPEIYLLLDEDEMVIVSVEVFDDDDNPISIKNITDKNFAEYNYDLIPLKIFMLSDNKTTFINIYDNNLLEELLTEVTNDYKEVLKKSISNLL